MNIIQIYKFKMLGSVRWDIHIFLDGQIFSIVIITYNKYYNITDINDYFEFRLKYSIYYILLYSI